MDTQHIINLDKTYVWHPFTPNDLWLDSEFEPIVIAEGIGSTLVDTKGKRYLDGNSSIWTNLHGHSHPQIRQAIKNQVDAIAHSSFLGLTNTQAPLLAERLCSLTGLDRCFFSDDGSTAMEAALKMVIQFFQQTDQKERTRVVSLSSAYHGDTVGAMSMGNSKLFHRHYKSVLFPVSEVKAPSCYRCPHNKAIPQKEESRSCRKCQFECLDSVEKAFAEIQKEAAIFAIEPKVQGAAGFAMQPKGYLKKSTSIARQAGAKIVLDEVMTGFGRTGSTFAFQQEDLMPDVVALAKGLTGGTLPLAVTLCSQEIFNGFSGGVENTFFHGHSYTGNPLGCAVARASLSILESPESKKARKLIQSTLEEEKKVFWEHPHVGDVRQEGLILAVELVKDVETREPFPYEKRLGAAVCQEAAKHGLLTRPVGDVLVLMPPYSSTAEQVREMVTILSKSIETTFASL
ncbi:MAG: adenosylmethionine--8-amino-7-oxononanoate transaminase [Verrucomicrobiota bacterium]